MTDLERARTIWIEWIDGPQLPLPLEAIAAALATARREGAEAATIRAENAEATAYAWADQDAYARGAAEMRERAAQWHDEQARCWETEGEHEVARVHEDCAKAIRALPLTQRSHE